MKSLFFFESMITPKVITFIYWLLLLVAVISGVASMFAGYGGISFTSFLLGILYIAGGALGARLWCELVIVLFKINSNLSKMAQASDE
ncbi:DUF4282 domain-containing protein [Alteromonas halophila]|uniref:Membrane protein n=1 Tax=Alteromonas halophila TaxID=516698 RepID=A0A918MWZ0_9ALTE|nr:DUF4282 domain-containing protein [Alteromonas halophila]GGW79173.1 membrane protein [Alteromonas halophila]